MSTPEMVIPEVLKLLARAEALDEEDPNEARVRLEILDGVLIAMGWRKESFYPESYDGEGGFTDYLLKSYDTPHLVVEAKRSGRRFTLPAGVRSRRTKAGALHTGGGADLKEAMEQAARYCNNHGAPFACVTNGLQWVFFRGTAFQRRGWKENTAVCFRSLEEVREQSIEFWNLLSFESVVEGGVRQVLDGERLPQASFAKRPHGIVPAAGEPLVGSRHVVNQLFEFYFSDIVEADQGRMLDACYVADQRVSEYDKELARLLDQQLLTLEGTPAQRATESAFKSATSGPMADDTARVVLVVGQVGAGKSTFLGRFFGKVNRKGKGREDADREARTFFSFKVDLKRRTEAAGRVAGDEAARLSERILEHISGRVSKAGKREYDPYEGTTLRTIFGAEIERLRRGPYAEKFRADDAAFKAAVADELERLRRDSTKLLPRFMKYVYRRSKRPFCLIIDNVDRSSDEYQQFAYTFCHGLAHEVPGVIIIAMRDTTYWRAREAGFLDTHITDTVFEVRPPSLKSVIAKRVRYAKQHIAEPAKWAVPRNRRKILPEIDSACDHIRNMLLGEDASGMQLLTSLGNRSVRRGLWLLKLYLQAPSSESPMGASGAKAHLLRALMLGGQRCYDSQVSPIVNLFRAEGDHRDFHSLRLMLLAYMAHQSQRSLRLTAAPQASEVRDKLVTWGIHRKLVMRALEVLVESGLLESDNRYIETPDTDRKGRASGGRSVVDGTDRLRISPSGLEYLRTLSRDNEYHLHCAGDAYWYDEEQCSGFVAELTKGLDESTGYEWLERRQGLLAAWYRYAATQVKSERSAMSASAESAAWLAVSDAVFWAIPDNVSTEIVAARESGPDNQAKLFADDGTVRLQLAIEALPSIHETTRVHGSGELARVLWVLELARRADLGPLSSGTMEKLLRTWGRVRFVRNNISRFFRGRGSTDWSGFWRQSHGPFGKGGRAAKAYELTEAGQREFDLQRPSYEL